MAEAGVFREVYRAHARDVRRFALFLCGNPAWADDLTSETFVRMWSARARVDLATVRAYLFTIARNLYLQQRRQSGRLAPLSDAMPDPQPSQERRVDTQGELKAVLAALQQLPEIDRTAVLLRAESAMPYGQIARVLGISETAAKVRVHRARLKLAEARRA